MPPRPAAPSGPLLPTPTAAAWRALTPLERQAFIEHVHAVLSDPALTMTEGRPHWDAKLDLLDALGLFYRTTGRAMYLAAEMAVLYPGELAFSPDVLAVADLANVQGDSRMAWIVADEGRGIDVAIEILHAGDRSKDLVRNVERYALLGIPEYFVYDRRDERVLGYRLTEPGARRYQRLVPQGGGISSAVLGVDFSVHEGRLKVFVGTSELHGSSALIGRLSGMLERAQGREQVLSLERDDAIEGLRAALRAALLSRGVGLSEEQATRITEEEAPAILQRWILRALGTGDPALVLADE